MAEQVTFTELPGANDKLREAEFFFMLMEKHFDHYEFKYFLSAFLSALSSCTEHNRLFSKAPRFKGWYEDVKVKYLLNADLQKLDGLRNKEIHHKGTRSMQQVGMSFPDGITTTSLELNIDFSAGKPVGTYKTAEMAEAEQYPVEYRWVWKTEGEPDVMELCEKGLGVVRELINSRDSMGFRD